MAILLKIRITCTACLNRPEADAQPNYCRKCGGRGFLKGLVNPRQLARLPDIPVIVGAITTPRIQKRQAVRP
jgi:hypothetical protein